MNDKRAPDSGQDPSLPTTHHHLKAENLTVKEPVLGTPEFKQHHQLSSRGHHVLSAENLTVKRLEIGTPNHPASAVDEAAKREADKKAARPPDGDFLQNCVARILCDLADQAKCVVGGAGDDRNLRGLIEKRLVIEGRVGAGQNLRNTM